MEVHFGLSDDELEKQVQNASLDPTLFTHEAHLRLAWIHIKKYGMERAAENICIQLRDYVNSLGAADKFNMTLTIASVKAVNHFIQRSNAVDFNQLVEDFPRLKSGFRSLIETHYSKKLYCSVTARAKYAEPDLLPFD